MIRQLLERGFDRRSASPYVAAFLRGDDLPNAWGHGGRPVTESDALAVVAVFACVRVIAETLASLPLLVYRRIEPRGRERATDHQLFWLLHDAPNPEMGRMPFWEAMVGQACLRGTSYAEIQRDQDNRVLALWPLRTDRMQADRTTSGHLYWRYRMPDGSDRPFAARDILSVPGFGGNGVQGYSPIQLHAEAIGLALDSQTYAAKFFQNDSRPGGVLQTKSSLSDPAFDRLKKSWEEAHQGVGNAHRVAILEEGVEWVQVAMSSRDAQFLEQRRFGVEEVARLFRVPPHLIQDLSRSTFTNIEHQSLDFVIHTLRPWAERVEGAIERSLLSETDRRTYFVEHLVDGLLRGDIQTRFAAYSVSKQNGWNSANDIRELENQNPIPADQGGDTYMVQLNMTPAGQLGQDRDVLPTGGRTFRAERAGAGGSAAARLRLARRYSRLFEEAAGRIVRREVADVRAAADRHLNARDEATFLDWLADYYRAFGAIATRFMLPTLLTYAEAVAEDAAAEIGSADGEADDLAQFVTAYAAAFGENYADRSRGQLEQQLRLATERGEDPLELVLGRLAEWGQKRPEKVASTETVRAGNAVTRERWKRGGIRRVSWVTQGGRLCAFCRKLDGKTVGIEQVFAAEGEDVEGDEGEAPLRVKRPTRHPPIHSACKCGLRPERG